MILSPQLVEGNGKEEEEGHAYEAGEAQEESRPPRPEPISWEKIERTIAACEWVFVNPGPRGWPKR